MHDELRERGTELGVGKRERFRARTAHYNARMARLDCGDERLRWIDCRHRVRAETLDQHARERPRSTPDVDGPLARGDACEVRKHGGERD